jgi:hypothetical protein
VQLAPDALAQTLHAVLKKANYKEISAAALPVLTVLSPRGGYFFGLAPVLDTDTMVKSFGRQPRTRSTKRATCSGGVSGTMPWPRLKTKRLPASTASALTGIAAVALILTQRMKYQKRSLEYQKKDLGALPLPQYLQQQRHLRHARRLG